MLISRTTGSASVVPELVYADVGEAVDWLCEAFGFTELWRAGRHRARVASGNGVVIVADADARYGRAVPDRTGARSHAVMVKVDNVDAHFDRARQRGARIVSPPGDFPYGERQYTAEDLPVIAGRSRRPSPTSPLRTGRNLETPPREEA